MDIDIIFKIAAVGIIVTIVCQILKKSDRDDIATIVSLAGLIIVLTVVLVWWRICSDPSEVFSTCFSIWNLSGSSAWAWSRLSPPVLLRASKPELSFAVTVAGTVIILLFAVDLFAQSFGIFSEIGAATGIDSSRSVRS